MRIEYHRTLIADRVRNEAFFAALKATIVKGETAVADIGAGTGLLGLMAAKLGAREVYLYEKADVARVASEVLRKNRVRNCQLMPCHSQEMQDPPRADHLAHRLAARFGRQLFEPPQRGSRRVARRRCP